MWNCSQFDEFKCDEKNKDDYEKIIDEAADKIENFIQKANLDNQIQ